MPFVESIRPGELFAESGIAFYRSTGRS